MATILLDDCATVGSDNEMPFATVLLTELRCNSPIEAVGVPGFLPLVKKECPPDGNIMSFECVTSATNDQPAHSAAAPPSLAQVAEADMNGVFSSQPIPTILVAFGGPGSFVDSPSSDDETDVRPDESDEEETTRDLPSSPPSAVPAPSPVPLRPPPLPPPTVNGQPLLTSRQHNYALHKTSAHTRCKKKKGTKGTTASSRKTAKKKKTGVTQHLPKAGGVSKKPNRRTTHPCPYEDCEKRFIYTTDLKRHVRVHTGERPFVCTGCKKAFRQKGALKSHSQRSCSALK